MLVGSHFNQFVSQDGLWTQEITSLEILGLLLAEIVRSASLDAFGINCMLETC